MAVTGRAGAYPPSGRVRTAATSWRSPLLLVLEDAGSGLGPLTVHTYFLAIGDTRKAVRYRIERLRSGRSFEHWCVDAAQDDVMLSRVTVILHRLEQGPTYAARPHRASSPDASRVITFEPPAGSSAAIREGLEIRRAAQWQIGDEGLPYQDAWIRCVRASLRRDGRGRAGLVQRPGVGTDRRPPVPRPNRPPPRGEPRAQHPVPCAVRRHAVDARGAGGRRSVAQSGPRARSCLLDRGTASGHDRPAHVAAAHLRGHLLRPCR